MTIEELIGSKYLLSITQSPLTKENGLMLVFCGDCDRTDDLVEFEKSICNAAAGHKRVHRFSLNAGALAINILSPLNQAGKSDAYLYDIGRTIGLKNINELALYGHYPCGEADSYNLSINDYLFWLAKAAIYCHEKFPTLVIACKFHIETKEGEFKTYYFDHLNWYLDNQSEVQSSAAH